MLMTHADTAMHSVNYGERKRQHFFQASMESDSLNYIEMEQHLRHALEQGEFQVFYQPQVSLDSGQVVGVAALLRWQRTGFGWVSPDQFIPLAEETGLIIPIEEWLLREACAQCQAWRQKGWKDLRISVALSGRQLTQANLSATVANILKDTGLKPGFLELELTEKVAMQHAETALKILKTLKQSGVQLSLDHFGTGYFPLRYLKQFPIDRLKIDRSFISNIANDPSDAAIVVAIIALAHCLGLDVIAEGVETNEQLRFLKMHGCNEAQGYLLGYPIPAGEFTELLHELLPAISA